MTQREQPFVKNRADLQAKVRYGLPLSAASIRADILPVIYEILSLLAMQKDLFLQCAFDSLSMFGQNTKNALLSHYQEHGLEFTPDEFDANKFCAVTSEMLGRSADFIFVKIIDDFCRRSGVSLEEGGLSGKARLVHNSDVLVSLFSKVKDGAFERRP